MSLESYGWKEEDFQKEAQIRGIDLSTFLKRLEAINKKGQPVKLHVSEVSNETKGAQLLEISIEPEVGFIHLCSEEVLERELLQGNTYHISICFVSEVWSWKAYERIRQKFNNRSGILSIAARGSAGYLTPKSSITRELLEDSDLHYLYSNGFYKDRGLHMSL